MQSRGKFSIILVIILILMLLCGCSKAASKDDLKSLQATVDELLLSNHSLEQRVTELENRINATPVPSATPDPYAKYTPEPTNTPAPVHSMTADEICSSLLKAGIPISSFTRYTSANDPEQIMGTETGYTSRVDFKDQDVTSAKGIIEVFPYGALASSRVDALLALMKSGKLPAETIYRYDNVILRLPADFDSSKCMAYEDALRRTLGLAK